MRPNYLAGRDYIFERLFTIGRQMQEVPEDAGIQKKNKASKDLNPNFGLEKILSQTPSQCSPYMYQNTAEGQIHAKKSMCR